MRRSTLSSTGVATLAVLMIFGSALEAQNPLGYVTARGSTVTPAYEGWYPNPDGTITLSWGFYNRNAEEVLEIPHGPDNFIEPAEFDGVQPTHFPPSRQWGAFGIVLPADYDGPRVTWTIKVRGETFTIPANTTADWKIDALEGEADGNAPPALALSDGGPWAAGPGGQHAAATAKVDMPTAIRVWAKDDGAASVSLGGGQEGQPVELTWFKHSGPGEVAFDPPEGEVDHEGGMMETNATFSEPGTYILRVRANDASGVTGAGHAQCCWTNAFVRVTVSK